MVVGAMVVEAAAAINAPCACAAELLLCLCRSHFRAILDWLAAVWNCFKTRFFLLHRAIVLNIDEAPRHLIEEPRRFMIVCSCNVLTDHDVRSAVNGAEDLPRNAKQLYGCLGCSAECGRCARTIKGIIDEALGACAKACCSGCPHSAAHADPHGHADLALVAAA
jgi:bacterioferritin-associated ferredoxin